MFPSIFCPAGMKTLEITHRDCNQGRAWSGGRIIYGTSSNPGARGRAGNRALPTNSGKGIAAQRFLMRDESAGREILAAGYGCAFFLRTPHQLLQSVKQTLRGGEKGIRPEDTTATLFLTADYYEDAKIHCLRYEEIEGTFRGRCWLARERRRSEEAGERATATVGGPFQNGNCHSEKKSFSVGPGGTCWVIYTGRP